MTPRLLATGTILLAVGLTLAAVVAEWFAAFGAGVNRAPRSLSDPGATLIWQTGHFL
jgi:hypothetical protein